MPRSNEVRVLLVDVHPLIVEAILGFVQQSKEVRIVGSCSASEAAFVIASSGDVQILVVDMDFTSVGAVEILKMLERRSLQSRMLLLSSDRKDLEILHAFKAGAAGCINRTMDRDEAVNAMLTIAGGGNVFPPHLQWLGKRKRRKGLTDRETEIIYLIAMGRSNHEIGKALGISPYTVRNALKPLCEKLRASDRTEVVSIAIRRGIIHRE